MNDVEKTNIERKNSGKRMRRRKRMMSVYTVVVLLLVLTVGVTMCFTFLFNIDEIVVSGESETYTSMDIVEVSGIHAGDNLFRTDTKKAEQRILDQLLYVETADVDRDFPSTLRIKVTRCVPAYNIQYDKGVLLVSRKGKILADNNFYTDVDNLPIIYGFDPADTEPGKPIQSKNENKYDAFCQLIKRFDRDDNTDISTIDLTNEYAITVNYRSGLIFKMGNWSDVEYKLDLAQAAMNDESIKGKKGYLMMVGSKQCSFRMSGEADDVTTAPIVTDENGLPVTTSAATTTTAVSDNSWQPDPDYSWQGDGTGQEDYGTGEEDYGQDDGAGDYGDGFGYDGYENTDIYDDQ